VNNHFPILNSFIEDTCVIAVIAYLLARGRMLELLSATDTKRSRAVVLGMVLGIIGVSEIVFPGDRSPYMVHTLLVTFATLIGGLSAGITSALVVCIAAAALLHSQPDTIDIGATLFAAALVSELVRRVFASRYTLVRAVVAGSLVQLVIIAAHRYMPGGPAPFTLAAASAPANGFGVLVLQLILNDAHQRVEGQQHKLDIEKSQAMVAEAQLMSLRARVHPHFLFNALTSIAALCSIDPSKAEQAIVRLSQLMRRMLESGPTSQLPLADELEYVRAYIEIEQHRFGDRLTIVWDIDSDIDTVQLPPFSVQILVENAVNHGIGQVLRAGTVRISARVSEAHVVIAVRDDGAGIEHSRLKSAARLESPRQHGLEVLTQQLVLLYGSRARLRLFSRPDNGTLACFCLPRNVSEIGE